jgi:uncharacterized SAM-binding protein YcdF (DUF218 family)
MFLLKKILSQFLMPLPVASILLLAALALIVFTRRRKSPALLVGAALLLILVGGNGLVADGLLRPLESRYAAFAPGWSGAGEGAAPGGDIAPSLSGPLAYVVVLGGGHVSDPSIPLSSQINEAAVIRLVEGIRLQRLFAGAKLIVSGGTVFDPLPSAKLMAELAMELGVPPGEIIQVDQPMDTPEEARCIAPVVGAAPFLLVTCASHMPRAVALFERAGTHPIPAPTHHLARKRLGPSLGHYFPSGYNLAKTERVIHERVGMLWARARGEG